MDISKCLELEDINIFSSTDGDDSDTDERIGDSFDNDVVASD